MSRRATMATFPRNARGLSLIELMISMLIGLMVVGSAIGVFISNQQTYRATEALARVQENARVGFELMAREVREAGGNPCARELPVANVLNNAGTTWWSTWGSGVSGHDNGALAGSVAGTDAIEVMSATSGGVAVAETPSKNSENFKVNTPAHGLEVGDIVMVCDYSQASIFQVTGANAANVTIGHNAGKSVKPGNCSKGLGFPVVCDGANGKSYTYGENSQIVEFKASRWYVGANNRGGRSLYRTFVHQEGGQVVEETDEVVEGIEDMQIQYLVGGAYADASAGLDWTSVLAVRITLTLASQARVGTDGEALSRQIEHVVTLRNRAS